MGLQVHIRHWIDSWFEIKPAYERAAYDRVVRITLGLLFMVLACFALHSLGAPNEASYLLAGMRTLHFDHPFIFVFGLALTTVAVSDTVGRIIVGSIGWFRRHIRYKLPRRKVREYWSNE